MSSLSPEEKRRIYEEEKARLESEQRAVPDAPAYRKNSEAGVAKIIDGLCAALFAVYLYQNWPSPAPAAAIQPQASQVGAPDVSPTCGRIIGSTAKDIQNIKAFCAQGIAGNGAVVGANANESLLRITVSREVAESMRADALSAKQLILTWMRGWRAITGGVSVTVIAERENVEVATGQSTLTNGDEVTIH